MPEGKQVATRTRISQELAAAKLRPPGLPAAMVHRDRLVRAVEAGTQGPLTLVVGPPGSGKTVLVTDWAVSVGAPVGWFTPEAIDSSSNRFWPGFVQALRAAGVTGLPAPDAWLKRDFGALLVEITAALADLVDPVYVVLDDFHELDAQVCGEMDRLLAYPLPALRMVFIARHDPGLRLGRLRLAGAVTEIRATDLACTQEETMAVVRGGGVDLPTPATTALWMRTEGWMAGVTLATISLRTSPEPARLIDQFGGEDALVSDYLMAEVLSRQSEQVQEFLVRTSVVEVLDGRLANALTGRTDGHRQLAALVAGGVLVTPVDARSRWFRYHSLFAELLRARLRFYAPELETDLRRRAARWYHDNDDAERAARHAVAARDWDLAVAIAADHWVDLLLRGEIHTLAPLLDAVPSHVVDDSLPLAVALAVVSLETESRDRARNRLARAKVVAGRSSNDPVTTTGLVLVELMYARYVGDAGAASVAAARALTASGVDAVEIDPALRSMVLTNVGTAESWTGRPAQAREHLRSALAAADDARSPWLRMLALAHLSHAEAKCGDMRAAQRRAEQSLAIVRRHGWERTSPAGAAAMMAALIATLQCRFDEAEALTRTAEAATFRPQDRPMRAATALPRLILLSVQGRHGEAYDLAREAIEEIGTFPVDEMVTDALHAWQARLAGAFGGPAEARAVLDRARPAGALVVATRARMLLDDGDPRGAAALVEDRIGAGPLLFPSVLMDLHLVAAMARDALDEPAAAADHLERALDLAAPADLIRPLLSHDRALLPLLNRHIRGGTRHGDLAERAIMLIEGRSPAVRTSARLTEPLSARELQILGLLPGIMSNQDIAARLYLSVNTVKTHMRSIYRKLGVDGRREAVRVAREQNLFAGR